jgi:hypothetical protein
LTVVTDVREAVPQDSETLDRKRLSVVLATIGISVFSLLLFYDKPWSNGNTAAGLLFLNSLIFGLYTELFRDRPFARLAVFGVVFGFVELIADALCVQVTGTLSYAFARSAMIWQSPWWMPGAWAIVAIQIGYLGAMLIRKIGRVKGAALCALIGAVNIPFYEEMAFHAHWWSYRSCLMLGHTPFYIIIAEMIIGAALAPLALLALNAKTFMEAARIGLVAGTSTIVGGLIGYGLVEVLLKNAV